MKKKISRKRTKRTRPTKQKARTTRHKRLTRQKAQHSKKRTNMKRSKRSYKKYNRERIIQEGGMKKLFGCSYCGAKSRRTSPESMTEEQQQAQLQRILDNLHAEKQGGKPLRDRCWRLRLGLRRLRLGLRRLMLRQRLRDRLLSRQRLRDWLLRGQRREQCLRSQQWYRHQQLIKDA